LNASGQTIASRYRVQDRIGEGGMGVVYRAFDEQLRRAVAVKFLTGIGGGTGLGRFRNEARTLSALSHPNIVTIFEIGEAQSSPFIAMELVEGETLRARLRRGRMVLRDAVDVVVQVARALGAAHDKGIVHRDIKPENVMIRHDGYAKVLDFGVAVLRAGGGGTSQMLTGGSLETVTAGIAGTPAYMSPEQIDGRALDPRSDLFSLGVMLCEMITGVNPFARAGTLDTISAIQRTPEPAAAMVATMPPHASRIVVKLLQRDPANRYPTSAALIEDLRTLLGALEVPQQARGIPRRLIIAAAFAVGVVAAGAAALYQRSERRHWVREVAAPQIVALASHDKAAEAMAVIAEARRYAPDDSELVKAEASATRVRSIHSTPSGAIVEVKDYLSPDAPWLRLGVTPLDNARIPAGYLRWRVSKEGVGESITAPQSGDVVDFDLAAAVAAPAGMVPVGGGPWTDSLAFLGWLGPYQLPPFFIDRYEVTNRQYQEFVASGGYGNSVYWKQPFVRDGRTLTFQDAVDLFRDATGRPGPSTWEGGHYPEGKGDYPVSGVSWFEAAAYAEFAGKRLPVIAQGYKATPTSLDRFIVAQSNLTGVPASVGRFAGLGPFGTLDLIGNVREWYWNGAGADRKYTLGRQANSYGPEALSAFDRSALNGFRCVRNDGAIPVDALAPRPMLQRDFKTARPVNDAEFRIIRNIYAYDSRPVSATVENTIDTAPDWTRVKVSYDAAYGGERMSAFVFLPKRTKPPFEAVVFFPSARVNFLTDSANLGDMDFIDYVIKSGRAVIYPIYKGFYERRLKTTVLPGPTLHRDSVIAWSKDLRRSIDYLESRPDINKSRIGFLGVSQGSAYGVILTALEPRFKAIVFLDGGMFQENGPVAGLDQVDFAPRLIRPVLMVNGRYDATFPYETAQLPMFRLLGSAAADKRHVVFDTPHDVRLRRDDLVKEVLNWFDKYLGRVN
jgi:formylglycine-generating enzyme required for sulfatase activity/dienelactone hydrolase